MTKSLYEIPIFQKGAIKKLFFFLLLSLSHSSVVNAQHSVARDWSEVMLESIRNDFARPTASAP